MNPRFFFPLLLLPALAVSACGGGASASPPRAKKPGPVRTATPRALAAGLPTVSPPTPVPVPPTVTPNASAPRATPTAHPTATATSPAQPRPTVRPAAVAPGHVISASLRPNTVSIGGALTASVTTAGPVTRVEMYLGSFGPTAPSPVAYSLSQVAPGAWTAQATAPSAPGQYHFTVGLYDGAGRRTVADRDGWNVEVTGQPTSVPAPQAQAIPDDIPLAPPFSYGNPVAASFTAGGRTVNGSELISTTRPDVSPSFVVQFYTVHLPRAGWAVDPSTSPAPGATTFSIYATQAGASGTRVCIVQYSGSTIHILYGTIPA